MVRSGPRNEEEIIMRVNAPGIREVLRGLAVATPGDAHDLLRVVDAGAPAVLHEDLEAARNLREGKVVEEDHGRLVGVLDAGAGIVGGIVAVVVAVNEEEAPAVGG